MDQHGRTEAGLVGEYAPLEALGHNLADNDTHTAADGSDRLESTFENSAEGGQNLGIVDADDSNAANNTAPAFFNPLFI